MELLKEEMIKTIIEHKMIILMACGFVLNSALEYYLGNSKHKSLVGFLKSLKKAKQNEPKP
jgi:hypothetical protein